MGLSVTNMMSAMVYGNTAAAPAGDKAKAESSRPQTQESIIPKTGVYADEKEKKENEEMVRKMQMSGTKLEALGEYFGSMQTALKDSGSDGIMAMRRTNNLIHNGNEYMDTSDYEEKETSKSIVKDLTESLKEGQEALEEKKAKKKEEEKKAEGEYGDNIKAEEGKPEEIKTGTDAAVSVADGEKSGAPEITAAMEPEALLQKEKKPAAEPLGGFIDISL